MEYNVSIYKKIKKSSLKNFDNYVNYFINLNIYSIIW